MPPTLEFQKRNYSDVSHRTAPQILNNGSRSSRCSREFISIKREAIDPPDKSDSGQPKLPMYGYRQAYSKLNDKPPPTSHNGTLLNGHANPKKQRRRSNERIAHNRSVMRPNGTDTEKYPSSYNSRDSEKSNGTESQKTYPSYNSDRMDRDNNIGSSSSPPNPYQNIRETRYEEQNIVKVLENSKMVKKSHKLPSKTDNTTEDIWKNFDPIFGKKNLFDGRPLKKKQ